MDTCRTCLHGLNIPTIGREELSKHPSDNFDEVDEDYQQDVHTLLFEDSLDVEDE
jgi:hypothetical protein